MSKVPLEEDVLRYAVGWGDMPFARVLIGVFGLFVLLATVMACCRKRVSFVPAVLWLVLSLALLVFATIPQQLITFVVSTEYMLRIRVIAGTVSLFVFMISFESIRRTKLQERYALLWIGTALVIMLCAVFPHTVALMRAVMGMNYVTAVVSVAFVFLFLVVFHFSISLSDMHSKQSRLVQRLAILESELKSLKHSEKRQTAENAEIDGKR